MDEARAVVDLVDLIFLVLAYQLRVATLDREASDVDDAASCLDQAVEACSDDAD